MMKKKKIKSLSLNKKSISLLGENKVTGGLGTSKCPGNTLGACPSLGACPDTMWCCTAHRCPFTGATSCWD